MKRVLLGIAVLSGSAHASFIANCEFETKLERADSLVRRIGGVVFQRSVHAKIEKATTVGMSHIKCEDVYTGKTITFPLQLLAKDANDKAAEKLGALKEGDAVKVKYEALNGRAAWGGGFDAVDYWFVK